MCLWTKHKYGCVARKDIVAYKSVFIENPDNTSAWRGVVYSEKRFGRMSDAIRSAVALAIFVRNFKI